MKEEELKKPKKEFKKEVTEGLLVEEKIPELKEDISNIKIDWRNHNHNGINSSKVDFGVIEHGELAGLSGDDHSQYHNNTRGDARYIKKDGTTTDVSANISLNTHKLTDVTDPASAQDAATKNYVDTNIFATPIILDVKRELLLNTNDNSYIAHLTYNSTNNNLYWIVYCVNGADSGSLGWATKNSNFDSFITTNREIYRGAGNAGILEVGSDVFISIYNSGGPDGIYRVDSETFNNEEVWGIGSGSAYDNGPMAYDGTYVYIGRQDGHDDRIRRYTIDDTNNEFDQDTNYVDATLDYKTLPVSLKFGLWSDGTYLYGHSGTKLYKVNIANNTKDDEIDIATNGNFGIASDGNYNDIIGVCKIGNQWYCFIQQIEKVTIGGTSNYWHPITIIGYPFSW